MIFIDIRTYIQDIVKVLQNSLKQEGFRINFLNFLLIGTFSGFSFGSAYMIVYCLLLLNEAIAWKAFLNPNWIIR
jgi:hypothetical protein